MITKTLNLNFEEIKWELDFKTPYFQQPTVEDTKSNIENLKILTSYIDETKAEELFTEDNTTYKFNIPGLVESEITEETLSYLVRETPTLRVVFGNPELSAVYYEQFGYIFIMNNAFCYGSGAPYIHYLKINGKVELDPSAIGKYLIRCGLGSTEPEEYDLDVIEAWDEEEYEMTSIELDFEKDDFNSFRILTNWLVTEGGMGWCYKYPWVDTRHEGIKLETFTDVDKSSADYIKFLNDYFTPRFTARLFYNEYGEWINFKYYEAPNPNETLEYVYVLVLERPERTFYMILDKHVKLGECKIYDFYRERVKKQ